MNVLSFLLNSNAKFSPPEKSSLVDLGLPFLMQWIIWSFKHCLFTKQLAKPDGHEQPFVLPPDTGYDSLGKAKHLKKSTHRFSGLCQVAEEGFTNPTMEPAQVIIFDNDMFGVLILRLRSFNVFTRVKRNLSAVHMDYD